MAARIEIKGTEEFRRLAARLKAAGQGQLARELGKALRATSAPAVRAARQSVLATSSAGVRGGGGQQRRAFVQGRAGRRGRRVSEATKRRAYRQRGLRSTVARSVQAKTSVSPRSASLEIRANSSRMPRDQRELPRHMNVGQWRHPVFGNRDVWVSQTATPAGWFDRPMALLGPKVRRDAAQVVDELADRLAA